MNVARGGAYYVHFEARISLRHDRSITEQILQSSVAIYGLRLVLA